MGNDKRPLPEYKTPNRIHYSRMLPKNSSRERSVSEVTGAGGIHRKPTYFAIQTRSEILLWDNATAPHRSLRSLCSLRSRLLFLWIIFWREPKPWCWYNSAMYHIISANKTLRPKFSRELQIHLIRSMWRIWYTTCFQTWLKTA